MTSPNTDRRAKRTARQKAYRATPEGVAALARYNASPAQKASQEAYDATPKSKTTRAKYRTTPARKASLKAYAGTPKGRANILLLSSRKSAKLRGLEHTISLSDIIGPEVCSVYGIRLDCSAGPRAQDLPSLDRIDNAKGYIPGNVRVISWAANYDKGRLSLERARALVSYMSEHLEK
jgi:hypothetical protein